MNDSEKLMQMIRNRIPLMTEEELVSIREALEESRIEHLLEMKEKQGQQKETSFPKLDRFRTIYGVHKCVFGRWPQWDKANDGIQPLYWLILREENGKLLLLSDSILEWMPFQTKKEEGCAWERSSLREWLNSAFYQRAFTAEERRRICWFEPNILSEGALMDHVSLPTWPDIRCLARMGASLTVRCQQKMKQSGWQDREYWIRKDTEDDSTHVMAFVLRNEKVSWQRCTTPAGVRPAIWILDDKASSDISI